MKNRLYILISASLLLVLGLSSCDPAKKYAAELEQIDRALNQLDSLDMDFANFPGDTLGALYAKVEADMRLVQNKFEGEMDMEVGVNFSRYRDIPKNIKNLGKVKRSFGESLVFSRKQLELLNEAIRSGANRDANGNSISELYIQKNVGTETKVVDELVQQMERMKQGGQKSFEDYEKYYPRVKPTLDALRNSE